MATKEERLKAMQRKLMNYDRRMIVFMKKAAMEPISMELDSPGEAIHLRQQMYRARKLMRDMDHPESPFVEGMQLKIVEPTLPGEKTLLIGVPISNKWDKVFKKAGISNDFDFDLKGTEVVDLNTLFQGDSPTPLDPQPISSKAKEEKEQTNSLEPNFNDATGPYGDDS